MAESSESREQTHRVHCQPAKTNKKEAVSSTIAPLSSLAKNQGLQRPGTNGMDYTKALIFRAQIQVFLNSTA